MRDLLALANVAALPVQRNQGNESGKQEGNHFYQPATKLLIYLEKHEKNDILKSSVVKMVCTQQTSIYKKLQEIIITEMEVRIGFC